MTPAHVWSLALRRLGTWLDVVLRPLGTRATRGEHRLVRRFAAAGGRSMYVHTGIAMALPRSRQRVFQWRLRRDARRLTTEELEALLGMGWRERESAFWLIAAGRRTDLRPRLAALLDEDPGPGTTDCLFTLARLGTEEDARLLAAHLAKPPPPEREDDPRADALAALLHLDGLLGTCHGARFLASEACEAPGFGEAWHALDRFLVFMDGGSSDLRAYFVDSGAYPRGPRGWFAPPFL